MQTDTAWGNYNFFESFLTSQMGVANFSFTVQIWTCNGGPRQQWIMDDHADTGLEIKPESDGTELPWYPIIEWSTDHAWSKWSSTSRVIETINFKKPTDSLINYHYDVCNLHFKIFINFVMQFKAYQRTVGNVSRVTCANTLIDN